MGSIKSSLLSEPAVHADAPPAEDTVRTSGLELRAISRNFDAVAALSNLTLSVHEREFVTLLGPSGCGKTTLLRIIAGFDRPTTGQVIIGGQDVTRTRPNRRPTNIVFQRAALFPHLNVFDNIAFGLRMERLDRGEIRRRVGAAIDMVRLSGYEQRRSHELSGGQVQRVALARAIVKRPKVLLFDEPLSALDLKIRLAMEVELRRIHNESESIFVYVTHDQREALALSDRIAVMEDGEVRQFATPQEIYRAPITPFVAGFVGDANVIPVEPGREPGTVRSGDVVLPHSCVTSTCSAAAWLVVRPATIRLGGPAGMLRGVVSDRSYRGSGNTYAVDVAGLRDAIKVESVGEQSTEFGIGTTVGLAWDPSASICLPRT